MARGDNGRTGYRVKGRWAAKPASEKNSAGVASVQSDVSQAKSVTDEVEQVQQVYDVDTPVTRDYVAENVQLRQANARLFQQLNVAKDRSVDLVRATLEGACHAMLT